MQAKRKLLTALLTLCMVLMLVPTAALAYGEGQHMSVKTGGFVDEDECGCFEIDGITYAPLSESTVAVVNPKQHPVVSGAESPYDGEIIIPSTVTSDGKTYTVTMIYNNAFDRSPYAGGTVTKITLPDTITEIGDSAFRNATQLEALNIPDSVTAIGSNAFSNCQNLKELMIPASVTDGVKEALTSSVSSGYPNAKDVVFADGSPYSNEDGVLYKGTTLEVLLDKEKDSVAVKPGTETIGESAFRNASVSTVTMPDSVTEIGEYAFYSSSVVNVDLSKNVKTIGKSVFARSDVSAIDLSNVTTIGEYAFQGCDSLNSVELSSELTSIGEWAFEETSIEKVIIPGNVKNISAGAFSEVETLRTIIIAGSVESIGEYAFSGLANRTENTTMIFLGNEPPEMDDNAFGSGEKLEDLIVVVPESAEENYKENNVLGSYIPETPTDDTPEFRFALSVPEIASVNNGTKSDIEMSATIPVGAVLNAVSSDEEVATAKITDEGKLQVTGVSEGTAHITVTMTLSGTELMSDTVKVTIEHVHDMVKTEAKDADCTNEGNIAYWHCESCGKYFADESGTNEITLEKTVVPVKEHNYENGICTVCGDKDPNYVPPVDPQKPQKDTNAATGDDSNMLPIIALMTLAAAGVAGTALYGRKKRTQ